MIPKGYKIVTLLGKGLYVIRVFLPADFLTHQTCWQIY